MKMKVPDYNFHNNDDDADSIEDPYNARESRDSDDSSDHAFPGFNTGVPRRLGVRNKNRKSQDPDPRLGMFSLNNHL